MGSGRNGGRVGRGGGGGGGENVRLSTIIDSLSSYVCEIQDETVKRGETFKKNTICRGHCLLTLLHLFCL